MIDSYAWRGGREAMLRFGEADWPTLIVLPPLFEESNRMRATLVAVMRFLAEYCQLGSVIPDLPGTGDSLVPTVDARVEHWREAVSAVSTTITGPTLTVAVRGGALLDDAAMPDASWRLEPVAGARLLRDMVRATALSSGEKMSNVEQEARCEPTRLAGNLIDPALFIALEGAVPCEDLPVRTARLGEGGDVQILGPPAWRRAEPELDWSQGADMAEDIFCWVQRCVAR